MLVLSFAVVTSTSVVRTVRGIPYPYEALRANPRELRARIFVLDQRVH